LTLAADIGYRARCVTAPAEAQDPRGRV